MVAEPSSDRLLGILANEDLHGQASRCRLDLGYERVVLATHSASSGIVV
jgi:hypothetical protein